MQGYFAVVDRIYCVPNQVDLIMKEKMFSLVEDQFKIRDRSGQIFFQVKGKLFSFGNRKLLLDNNGNEVVGFRKKYLTFRKTYLCYKGEEELFLVKRAFKLFGVSLSVKVVNKITGHSCKIKVDGNFMNRSFRVFIKETNQTLAVASRDRFNMKDIFLDRQKYVLSVMPGVDASFIVVLILAIAEIRESSQGSN